MSLVGKAFGLSIFQPQRERHSHTIDHQVDCGRMFLNILQHLLHKVHLSFRGLNTTTTTGDLTCLLTKQTHALYYTSEPQVKIWQGSNVSSKERGLSGKETNDQSVNPRITILFSDILTH